MTQDREDQKEQADTPEPASAAGAAPIPAAAPDETADTDAPATPSAQSQAASGAAGPPAARQAAVWQSAGIAVVVVLGLAVIAAATFRWWGPAVADSMGVVVEPRIAAVESRVGGLGDELAQLAERLENTESRVAALREDLAGAQSGKAAADSDAATGDLAQRVARLEAAARAGDGIDPQTVTTLAHDTGRLAAELNQLKDRVDTLARSSADAATVLRLADRVDAAEAAAREAAAKRGSAQAVLLAIGQLREAVNRGDAFASELKAVGAVLDGNEAAAELEKLARHAPHGIPTRTALTASFEELAGRVVRADLGPDQDGLWRQTVQRLASLVTVRRTEGEGAGRSAAALVARAEHKLEAGDLAGALAELSVLEGPALETAGRWMADARARVTADKVLSDLTAQAVAMTARSEG